MTDSLLTVGTASPSDSLIIAKSVTGTADATFAGRCSRWTFLLS
jgi:hypothetical protein